MKADSPRPNPDFLLERIKMEDVRAKRGRLKVFLGACAGVGKTYTMLEDARLRRDEGVDVVAGIVETHGRVDTESRLAWVEQLPRLEKEHRGVLVREFDLDGALRRKPQLILVDELAHTNAPGSRHLKRWQDVKELIDNGLDVYTTVNIQHLESLNDVVAQVTGQIVQETVPDSFLEGADAIELVDLPYEELNKRLAEGKIYLPEQAERARQNFFRPGNVSALRELALRYTAEKVNEQVQAIRREQLDKTTWPTHEKILVLIGANPSSAKLIRHACRLAKTLHCEWVAFNVETLVKMRVKKDAEDRTVAYLRMASKLGAETVTLTGADLVETTLDFAREKNITKIIVGKPQRRSLRDWLFGSVSDQLVRRSGEIDVIVTRGDPESAPQGRLRLGRRAAHSRPLSDYYKSLLIFVLCTVICGGLSLLKFVETTNLIMIYLLGVILVASRFGRGPGVLICFLSVLAFDFFLVEPHFSFAVADAQYIFTFFVMLSVSLVISTLTVRLRESVDRSRLREQRTASMNVLSRKLAMLRGQDDILQATVEHISELFDSEVLALLPDAKGRLNILASKPVVSSLSDKEQAVAQWGHDIGQMAGRGTDTVPSAERLYVPMLASHCSFGALGLKFNDPQILMSPEQLQLLESMAQLTALALEVDRLTEEAQKNQLEISTEKLRNSLLSSVSHDLRTPLAAITGAASSLLGKDELPEPGRRELLQTIYDEAERLSQQVANLLEMSRLESGTLNLRLELQPLEETLGSACQRLSRLLANRSLQVSIPADLPMISADSVLLEKVFFNLLENALKYTPAGTPIEIVAHASRQKVTIEFRDHGPGLAEGEDEKIFEKFYRSHNQGGTGGAGLGLTICRGIIEAHGGEIRAANRPDGGAIFLITLPVPQQAQPLISALGKENSP